MSTQSKIQYAWLILGIVFGIVGIVGLVAGNMGSILTLAVAALILWQGTHNMGGLEATKYTIIRDFRLLGRCY